MNTPQKTPGETLAEMTLGMWVARAIYAAAELGIADRLVHGPLSVDALAQATETHNPSLFRLLRALASIGIFRECEPRCFALTPLAECLIADRPGSMKAMVLMMGDSWHWKVWEEILYSLRTGRNAVEHLFGCDVFAYFAKNPKSGRTFNEAMTSFSTMFNQPLADAYDFSDVNVLADVGGGHGSLLLTILDKYPKLKGVLADAPHVLAEAREHVEKSPHASRVTLRECDFFESVPAGADAYLLKNIIHDWDDVRCGMILDRLVKAMPAHGRILIAELIIPLGNDPFLGKISDLEMMISAGNGKERTVEEYESLLARSQLRLARVVPTKTPMSLIEAVKA